MHQTLLFKYNKDQWVGATPAVWDLDVISFLKQNFNILKIMSSLLIAIYQYTLFMKNMWFEISMNLIFAKLIWNLEKKEAKNDRGNFDHEQSLAPFMKYFFKTYLTL